MRNRKFQEIGKVFDKELKDIQIARRTGVDRDASREIGIGRLTDGIVKFEEWKMLKKKLIKEPRREDLKDKRIWFL